jgi:thioredoxin reductase (NADPH)
VSADTDDVTARLATGLIDLLRRHGRERATSAGELLFREGDRTYEFLVILAGTVVAVDGYGAEERELGVGGPGDFVAELNLITGERLFSTAVVRDPGAVLAVPVKELTELIGTHPELGEAIMPTLLARRTWLNEHQAGFQIVGSRYSDDTARLREFAAGNRLPHSFVDLDRDQAGRRLLDEHGLTPAQSPAVLLRGGDLLVNPSNRLLAQAVGLNPVTEPGVIYDLIVVGAGPAGLAAAVYASSDGLRVVTIDTAGTGGQIGTTSRVENYLGFPVGISGAEFATRAVLQAQRFGTKVMVPGTAVACQARHGFHVVRLQRGEDLVGRSVIIATGMHYRRLNLPGEDRFAGRSLFYTPVAVYDGLDPAGPVLVVGDGNSAGQAATALATRGHQVTMVIRGADLSHTMGAYLIDRIDHDPQIAVLPYSQIVELAGEVDLQAVWVQDLRSGLRHQIKVGAVFVMIGAEPQTGWLDGSLQLDESGFVLTGQALGSAIRSTPPWLLLDRDPYPLESSLPGVFAAGDVRADSTKRVGSAVGDGSLAARMVHEWLGSPRAATAVRSRLAPSEFATTTLTEPAAALP